MTTFTPGDWYLMFVCNSCETRQVLFPDLSNGKSDLKAIYVTDCGLCGHKGSYDGDAIERYQHPKNSSPLN